MCRTGTYETYLIPSAQRRRQSPPYLLQKNLVGGHFVGFPWQWGCLLPYGRPFQDRALGGACVLDKPLLRREQDKGVDSSSLVTQARVPSRH